MRLALCIIYMVMLFACVAVLLQSHTQCENRNMMIINKVCNKENISNNNGSTFYDGFRYVKNVHQMGRR